MGETTPTRNDSILAMDNQQSQVDETFRQIATSLSLGIKQVRVVVELLTAGNTIPFIARYRKEATGGLDESALRAIEDAWEKARAAFLLY